MSIPIQNIYYLLSYAWGKGEYGKIGAWKGQPGENIESLLAWMLKEAIEKIPLQSPQFSFRSTSEVQSSIKGKVDLSRSYKQNTLSRGKAWVRYEHLVQDRLYLKIARSSWDTLKDFHSIPMPKKLTQVQPISLSNEIFRRAQSYYFNSYITYLLKICEWCFCHFLPTRSQEGLNFEDWVIEEEQMPILFEAFIRNFYRFHAKHFNFVGKERLKWNTQSRSDYLPMMETDVSLISPNRKILIECKFYKEALKKHYQGKAPKFHSTHLYQIFSYLNHATSSSEPNRKSEGILIYPTVNFQLNEEIELSGIRIRINTLDLNRHWTEIHKDLVLWVQ